jgi:succinoglycan biosynthesis transport protein ExoP
MEQTSTLPGTGIKPLLSLKRHHRLSIVIFLLVLAVGMPVVWIKGQSSYSAEAVFQVSPRYMKNLKSDQEIELQSNSQYREFVNHLQNTVLRYDVVGKGLDLLLKKDIDTRPSSLTRREYIERLQRSILTLAIPDTYMVRVRLDGGPDDKTHLHRIVNAVTSAFLETTKIEQIYGSEERYIGLNETKQELDEENAALNTQRAQLAGRLGLTTFRDGVTNPYDSLLAQLREKLTNASVERERADAAYQAFVERGEIPTELGRSLLDMRLGDTRLNGLRSSTHSRVTELRQKLNGLGPKHPARPPAEAEIALLEETLAEAEAEFERTAFANFESRLAASRAQYRAMETGIRENVTRLEGQASEYAQLFQQAMALTRLIDENRRRIEQIQERMNYLETESDALGFVRLVTPALPAEMPMGIGKKKLLAVLMLLALAAALGAPLGIDMLGRRIHSVNDAEKLLGMPAAGWQIAREDLPTELFATEQSRRFAATMIRNRARLQRSAYAFTAVNLHGGTSTTVRDTARTLLGLGAKVLVVDANTFTPNFGVDPDRPGLSDALLGNADAAQIVQHLTHGGAMLDTVGIGSLLDGGLQRLDRLQAMIDDWNREYEYILFDLPPLLLSADAEMLIEQIGQVFLVVECESATKGEILRAKRQLQKIDPEAVGLFVNRVPLFRGGAGGYIEQSVVETLTRDRFSRFDAGAYLRLQLELVRTRWALRRRGWLRGRAGSARRRRRRPDRARAVDQQG